MSPLQPHELGHRIVTASVEHLHMLARLYQRFMDNDERDGVLALLSAAVLADETIVQRPELIVAMTLPSNVAHLVPRAGAGSATATATAATAVAIATAAAKAGASAAVAKAAAADASEGTVSATAGSGLTNVLAVDFVGSAAYRDTVAAIEDRAVRRVAARERVMAAAAARVNGAVVAALIRPVVATVVGGHGTGLPELRVVGDNTRGLAACLCNMFPAAVRRYGWWNTARVCRVATQHPHTHTPHKRIHTHPSRHPHTHIHTHIYTHTNKPTPTPTHGAAWMYHPSLVFHLCRCVCASLCC